MAKQQITERRREDLLQGIERYQDLTSWPNTLHKCNIRHLCMQPIFWAPLRKTTRILTSSIAVLSLKYNAYPSDYLDKAQGSLRRPAKVFLPFFLRFLCIN
uniref:Putative uncharacterized protein YML116W-A n=1 Tax=Saccharomyces cerevisiae (strain ATCC 204508 / S288c) TaxID=559292 RepID=YM116_YEAST|nr:RecName: Full=Putative uncharacterized protein YML116W-A [Saccharomyces cerevisiae S288C]pir/S69860/ hypothetical protein YML116w-a - yeast (Saccharomyces cerevisiae) [Saccharomyces cerevisiae]AAT93291.1 YML117W-A [Saccharomyces cerevisiae]